METMSGFMLLTFWLCAGVNYIMLRNMSKRQKGLLLGVTLPPEADALPEVQAIVKQYRTQLGTLCLVCAALSVPLAFVQETAIALTLWMLFFFAGLALPYLPLLRANAKLKALKKAAAGQNAPTRVVDTAASAFALPKPMGLWTLLPPLVLSLAPIALPGLPRGVALACGIDAATLLLLWVLGRTTFRRREDMVTADSARNQTLLRVRRLYWDRFWRLNLWALAVLNGMLALGFRSEATILGGTLGFTVLLVAATLWMELSVRRAQAVLTDAATIVADEDDAWLGGIFYYNPTDKRFLVAKRIGLGSTVNLGTWAGKLYYAFVGLVLVACLAIGPIFGLVDSIPTRLERSGLPRGLPWPERKIPLGHRRHHRCPAPGHPAGCRPHLGHRDGPLFAGGFLCGRGGERPVLPRPHPKVFSPGGGSRAGVLVHRRFRGPHRRHCAGTAIHRSPLMQRAAGAEFWLPQPFLFVICPKTQPICKKCYNFFFKNGVLPLTALL